MLIYLKNLFQKFQLDFWSEVIVVTSPIGATGLNMQFVDTTIIAGCPKKYARLQQAACRGHRKGRSGDSLVVTMILANGIDDKRLENLDDEVRNSADLRVSNLPSASRPEVDDSSDEESTDDDSSDEESTDEESTDDESTDDESTDDESVANTSEHELSEVNSVFFDFHSEVEPVNVPWAPIEKFSYENLLHGPVYWKLVDSQLAGNYL
jgi:hypothetical protein